MQKTKMRRTSVVSATAFFLCVQSVFASFEAGVAFFRQGDYAKATPIFNAYLPADAQFRTDCHKEARAYLLAMGTAEAPAGGAEDEGVREFIDGRVKYMHRRHAPYRAAKGFALWRGWWNEPGLFERRKPADPKALFLAVTWPQNDLAAMYLFALYSPEMVSFSEREDLHVYVRNFLERLADAKHVAGQALLAEVQPFYAQNDEDFLRLKVYIAAWVCTLCWMAIYPSMPPVVLSLLLVAVIRSSTYISGVDLDYVQIERKINNYRQAR